MITCATTSRVVTSFTQKKTYNNGTSGEWTYLRCWNPKNSEQIMYVKENRILQEVQKVFDSMHLEPELLEKVIDAIKSSANAEKDYYKEKVKELQSEHNKLKNRMDKLTDLFLDGDFGEAEYKVKRKSLEQKRDDLLKEIESNNRADNNFSECLVGALKLASGAGKAFRSSDIEQKRKLVNLVFQNLELKGHKLRYTLRPPFDAFVKLPKNGEWCALEDSNL